MNITELLGASYSSLLEAKVDKSPDEIVITKDDQTFFIVAASEFDNTFAPEGFKVVVKEGE